jgi:hypothetical protein
LRLGRGRGCPTLFASPALRAASAFGPLAAALAALTGALRSVTRTLELVGRSQLDRPDRRRVDRADGDAHRADRGRAQHEADGDKGQRPERDPAVLARASTGPHIIARAFPGRVFDETVLMIVGVRVGHAPRESSAEGMRGL